MQKCDGVKILDLEEKQQLTGTEYLVTAEKGENHKIPLNAVTDTVINSSKFKAAIAEVYESSTPTASVTLDNDQFLFSFGIPAGRRGDNGKDGRDGRDGIDGNDGIPGMPGIDGDTTRLVIAFKSTSTAEAPDTPIGGSWDYATNIVTYPEGWSGSDKNLNGYLWSSNATFSSNGTIVVPWSDPVPFGGKDGRDGADGTNIQYVYKLTITNLVRPNPDHPTGSQEDAVRQGWTDHPTGMSEQYQCEWVSYRNLNLDTNTWSEWYPCTIWSKWGVNGKDGDGVEYVYQRTKLPMKPHAITDNNPDQDDYIPQSYAGEEPWTDNPSGVNETYKWEWVSQRNYKGDTKKWDNFMPIALWAKYGDPGQDGQGLRVMYTKTTGSDVEPVVGDRLNINPGSIWSNAMPRITGKEALWAIQALVTFDNKIYIDENLPENERGWQGPCLISGVPGLDGNNFNYQVEVFIQSDTEPDRPTNSDPYHPNNGWMLTPNSSSGVWWKCVGTVSGETGQIIEWGAPIKQTGASIKIKGTLNNTLELPMTGNEVGDAYVIDGVLYVWNGEEWIPCGTIQGPAGEDGIDGVDGAPGNYTEYRFARNNSWETPPVLNKSERFPDTIVWRTSSPPPSDGKVLWSTYAIISGADNTLIQDWCDPYYLTPLDAETASGTPGVGYEIRYCKGTEISYTATYDDTVKTTRDPSSYGWSLDYPDITTDTTYRFVWFIQARIIDGEFEDPNEGWWKPQPFSGVITPSPQKSNPIIYPAGIYSSGMRYINDGTTAPYVYFEGSYYVLTKITGVAGWISSENNNENPATSESWLKFEMFDAWFANVGIIENGLVGGAVFNENRMFSQRGKNSQGGDAANYEVLTTHDPNNPITTTNIMNGSTGFTPNFLLDFATGEAYFNAGGVHLSGGDESYIKLKNGSFNTILNKTGLSITGGDLAQDVIAINNTGLYVDMPTGGSNLRHTAFSVNPDCAQMYSQNTTASGSDLNFHTIQHFKFNTDGSGELANGNIKWDSNGNIIFGDTGGEVDVRITSLADEFNPAESVGYIDLPTLKENESRSYFLDTPTFSLNYTGHAIHGTFNNLTVYTMPTNYGDDYIKETITSESNPKRVTLPSDSVLIVHGNRAGGNSSWKITQIARRSW